MPNRILRDGILSSERVARLNWAEEVFYRRLMSVVDDFGRYHANPKLLRAALYPLLIDKVSDADIGKWLAVCAEAALVSVYPAPDGKRYLQLLDFRQQARADKSRFPQMPDGCAADATHVPSIRVADAPVFGDVGGDGDGDGKAPRKRSAPPIECPADVAPQVWADWLELRRKKKAPVTPTVVAGAIVEAGRAGMTLEAFLTIWCVRGSQGLEASWLKPHERQAAANGETPWQRSQRERVEEMSPGVARKAPGPQTPAKEIVDVVATVMG